MLGRRVPVPASTVASWSEADDVDAYALIDGDVLVGYGEVWTDDDEAECCYLGAGFLRMSAADERSFDIGQPVDYVWMHSAGAAAG